jgi:hypothetical protein
MEFEEDHFKQIEYYKCPVCEGLYFHHNELTEMVLNRNIVSDSIKRSYFNPRAFSLAFSIFILFFIGVSTLIFNQTPHTSSIEASEAITSASLQRSGTSMHFEFTTSRFYSSKIIVYDANSIPLLEKQVSVNPDKFHQITIDPFPENASYYKIFLKDTSGKEMSSDFRKL